MGDEITYAFVYKCRLCEAVYRPTRAVETEAPKLLAMMADGRPIRLTSGVRLGPLMLHDCNGINVAGRTGISDILGTSEVKDEAQTRGSGTT